VVLVVVEGHLEEHVAARLLGSVGLPVEGVTFRNMRGNRSFWREARRFNEAARNTGLVLGLTDLDGHPCAGGLIRVRLESKRHPNFLLRIPVRELESWLLADARAWARFLGVAEAAVPRDPDGLPDPKQSLVNLVRRSRARALVADIVPEPGRPGPVGPGYTTRMTEFVAVYWDPDRASANSPSLFRALRALRCAASS
jgi:hypothetical protein